MRSYSHRFTISAICCKNPDEGYSPKLVEGEFSEVELPIYGVLQRISVWLTRIASCVQTDGSAESFTRPAMHKRRARVNISATRCRYGIYGEFSWAFVLEEKG